MTDSLVIRALAEDEATAVFNSLPDPGLVGRAILGPPLSRYQTRAAGGTERPEWTWVAFRGEQVVARAAFWGSADDTEPKVLGWFDFSDHHAAVELLRRAPYRPEYELPLPPDWRSDPAAHAAALARVAAAEAAGYTFLTERLRYRWTPDCGIPERTDRLVFRPEPDDAVILDVLQRVHSDTVDAHARLAIAEGGLRQAAQEELDFFSWCRSPREWWQLALTPDGEVAGIQVPVHNPTSPAVGFIGVMPEQRGRGYGYDLLVECTRKLATEGADRIAGATDCANVGMAKAFSHAGYPVTQHVVCMTGEG